ncbi:hypothetical protein StoSoilA2_19390 [Arthrobacter sp. StoSoilA2]|nr:hypothetical protein StoSoilA2_19390 [Arthrobacter sp. StoSoilA2]
MKAVLPASVPVSVTKRCLSSINLDPNGFKGDTREAGYETSVLSLFMGPSTDQPYRDVGGRAAALRHAPFKGAL